MARGDTYKTYLGNGVTTDYPITFSYIKPEEVVISRNDVVTSGYIFINPSVIKLNSPLGAGEALTVQRVTNIDYPAVVWKNGSGTTGEQLNAMVRQLLNALQEVRDSFDRALSLDPWGRWNAKNRRIINVADPVENQDAVTKKWAETSMTSTLAQALEAMRQAWEAANLARAWADNDYNVPVIPGKYSAKHWAKRAELIAGLHASVTPFDPAGDLQSTNVQDALYELDNEKASRAELSQGLTDANTNLTNTTNTLNGQINTVSGNVDSLSGTVENNRTTLSQQLTDGLNAKANVNHTHEISQVNGLQGALDGKAAAGHNHDGVYAPAGHNHDGVYAPASHTHSQYATTTYVDNAVAGAGGGGVEDVRLGAQATYLASTMTSPPNGYVMVDVVVRLGGDGNGERDAYARPLQKKVGGSWVTVSVV